MCRFVLGLMVLSLGSVSAYAGPVPAAYYAEVQTNTPVSMTVYGWLSVSGVTAPAGTEIAFYDQAGTLCGASGVDVANGGAYVAEVYGDDATSAGDEGAVANEPLTVELRLPSGETIPMASLEFSPAGYSHDPEVYPPLFEDKARYGMNVALD